MENSVYIDGCNVAECRNLIKSDLKKPICKNGGLRGGNRSHLCEDNNDCYFRQLQRKTKECENVIHNWQFSEKLYSEIKTELEQYKKSKQASYEAMQREWNAAINEYKKIILENEHILKIIDCKNGTIATLEAENEKLKEKLNAALKNNANITALKLDNKDLLAENEWLKEIANKALNDKNKWLDKYNILLSENEKLKAELDKYKRVD